MLDPLPVAQNVQSMLAEAREQLGVLYGDRLVAVVLFGSQARGEARAESDVDLIVVLRGPFHIYDEVKRTSPLVMEMLLTRGMSLSLVFVPEERYHDPHHPLMMNVHAEGIAL